MSFETLFLGFCKSLSSTIDNHMHRRHIPEVKIAKDLCYWSEHYEHALVQEGYTYIIDEVSVQRRWLHLLGNS